MSKEQYGPVSHEDYERAVEFLKGEMGADIFEAFIVGIESPAFMKRAERQGRVLEAEMRRREGYRDFYDELGPDYLEHAGSFHRSRIADSYSMGDITLPHAIGLAVSDIVYRKVRTPFKIVSRIADSFIIGWNKTR